MNFRTQCTLRKATTPRAAALPHVKVQKRALTCAAVVPAGLDYSSPALAVEAPQLELTAAWQVMKPAVHVEIAPSPLIDPLMELAVDDETDRIIIDPEGQVGTLSDREGCGVVFPPHTAHWVQVQ